MKDALLWISGPLFVGVCLWIATGGDGPPELVTMCGPFVEHPCVVEDCPCPTQLHTHADGRRAH